MKNLKKIKKIKKLPIFKTFFKKEKNFGKIENIITSFGFDTKRIKPDSRLYNKMLGGGAILDVGCYPLSLSTFINSLTHNVQLKDIILKPKTRRMVTRYRIGCPALSDSAKHLDEFSKESVWRAIWEISRGQLKV